MPRYAWRLGNTTNNPAESVDTSGDTGDAFVVSVENPQGSGTVVWGITPSGIVQGAGALALVTSVTTTGATITPAAASFTLVRATPAAAVTGVILAAGTINGQQVFIDNQGSAGATISWAVDATSNVANGLSNGVPVGQGLLLTWDATATRWVAGNLGVATVVNAGAITTGNTITPLGVPNTLIRCAPAGAITGVIVAVGTFDGQIVDVVNESAAASTITFAAAGTSHVADGATTAIAGVTARRMIWNNTAALWFKVGG